MVIALGMMPPVRDGYLGDRRRMVETQIQARGITDQRVLKAILKVPRHQFVSLDLRAYAHADHPLNIGYGQTISQPYMVAYMTEVAELTPTDNVLEIGTGCGYQAAILAELVQAVYTVELIPELATSARRHLQKLGYRNIHFKIGDGYQGWADHAPYDAIIVTAAPDHVPEALIEQLADHGKMVIPVGTFQQYIEVLEKTERGILAQKTMRVQFVPLCHPAAEP